MDYACSDGEEAISLYALLGNDRNKFKITGIDISSDAISLSNKGVYSLFGGFLDEFLMPDAKRSPKEQELADMFHKIMEPTNEPDEPLNNRPEFMQTFLSAKPKLRKQLFFKPKDDARDNFIFKVGDIQEIDKEHTEGKVGAIFFRNAFYHLMNSSDGEDLITGRAAREVIQSFSDDDETGEKSADTPESLFGYERTLEEKQAIADKIVDKVYDKLETGGVFVLGRAINESLFIADDTISTKDTIRFGDTEFYKKTIAKFNKQMNNLLVRADMRFIPAMRQMRENLAQN